MIWLLSFLLGLLLGLILRRRLRPLLFERWRGLQLLVLLLLASLLPAAIDIIRPEILWTGDRRLLITLLAIPYLLALALIIWNLLPESAQENICPPVRLYHRIALLIVAAGLIGEASVVLLNRGYMPISQNFLNDINDPALQMAIRNQALRMKELIGPNTVLPWLGQVWRFDFLRSFGPAAFPYISPGQVVTAAGLFLTGITSFFGDRDMTGR